MHLLLWSDAAGSVAGLPLCSRVRELLCRSSKTSSYMLHRGVSNIRLVDFDYVTLSSLNRHATATLADVGSPKVLCAARTLQQISRFVKVDPRIELWRAGEGNDLLDGADWVIGMFKTYIL